MSEKLVEHPQDIFQQDLNDLVREDPTTSLINDLLTLMMYYRSSKREDQLAVAELYNITGIEEFSKILVLLGGKTLKLPTADQFKDSIQIALCYYYRVWQHKSWREIKALLRNKNIPTVFYGLQVQRFAMFLKQMGDLTAQRLKLHNAVDLEDVMEGFKEMCPNAEDADAFSGKDPYDTSDEPEKEDQSAPDSDEPEAPDESDEDDVNAKINEDERYWDVRDALDAADEDDPDDDEDENADSEN